VPAPRQPTGTAFALRDALPWKDLSAIVRACETAGYDAVFLPEIAGRDAFVTLGALAGETRDLTLATGIVPMRSRTAILTAMAAATVQERSGGRHVLGIGTGSVGAGALDELAEQVRTVRGLMRGDAAERRGRSVRLALEPDPRVPIWISALGPKAMRLGGAIADGVLLNWCTPERVERARVELAEGASQAGRDPQDVTLGVYVRAWTGDDDREDALLAIKRASGEYASFPAYARQLEAVGLGVEAAAAAEANRAGRPDLVPDELVDRVCAFGDGAAERLEAYEAAGADLVVVYPVAGRDVVASVEATLMRLAPGAV